MSAAVADSSLMQNSVNAFREQILAAKKNQTPLSIEGGATKNWYGNPNSFSKLSTTTYQGILDYQPEELVITACAGTPLQEIEMALTQRNQVLAFEPPHFGDKATFGGAIAGETSLAPIAEVIMALAELTAAWAPAKRILNSPSCWSLLALIQALAESGSGCPAHSFSSLSACACESIALKVRLAAGFGNTFTEASSNKAKVPREPGSRRETS